MNMYVQVYFHFGGSIYLGIEFLDHVGTVSSILRNCTWDLPKQWHRFLQSHCSSVNICYYLFVCLFLATPMSVKWYLVVLICIFVIIIWNSFLCAYWPFVYCLWRNVCSNPFAHFKIRLLVFLLLNNYFFYIFWMWIPYKICNLQIFPPIM